MQTLAAAARAMLNLELTGPQLACFQAYAEALQEWNEKFNLTAITDLEGIQVKHFLDSLSILKVLPPAGGRSRVIDVGSGAGFPGLPLKIVCPEMRLTLLEATGKKARFCEAMVEHLKLSGVTVLKGRAEEIGQDPAHREQYDWAMARAVAEMRVLSEYLLPLVRRGGHIVAQKREDAPSEAHAAENAMRRLGGQLKQLVPVELPGVAETRYLVVVEKVAASPPGYPRRPGVPGKSPIS